MDKEDKPKMKNLFIEMPVDDHQRLRMLAAVRGLTMKDVVITLVRQAAEKELPKADSEPAGRHANKE